MRQGFRLNLSRSLSSMSREMRNHSLQRPIDNLSFLVVVAVVVVFVAAAAAAAGL